MASPLSSHVSLFPSLWLPRSSNLFLLLLLPRKLLLSLKALPVLKASSLCPRKTMVCHSSLSLRFCCECFCWLRLTFWFFVGWWEIREESGGFCFWEMCFLFWINWSCFLIAAPTAWWFYTCRVYVWFFLSFGKLTEVVDFEISWQVEKMRLELDNQCFCTCFRQVDIWLLMFKIQNLKKIYLRLFVWEWFQVVYLLFLKYSLIDGLILFT